ncbi:D-glycero-beta-D-manno-heptose 1-phosphate adenylyltransferase [bacterium]|nr:MAG: D-glycero-beta-D-manno-heptose 1-phosphate adenylyltransferase [bacterium]
MKIISPTKKIFGDFNSFAHLREKLRRDTKVLVFTNGCFDILHRGHCEYLFRARQLGDFLLVGLNTDDSVRRLKGSNRPYQPLEDRAYVLASLSFVDAVIPFSEDTPRRLILSVRPDVLVKGADYDISEIVGAKEVLSWGGKVERIPLVEGKSTTAIVEKIRNSK